MKSNISIASSARLCELNISVVTGSKQDKDATSKVNEDNNAADNVAKVTKNIFAHSEVLPEIVKFAAQVRAENVELSLPFNDSGQRLIPNDLITKHMKIMGKNKQKFMEKVEKFKEELPQLREHAEDCLGELYNEYDYPSEEEVEVYITRKFRFSLEYPPVPESGGFLNGVLDDVKDDLNDMHDKAFDQKMKNATAEMWNRLVKCLQRLSAQLTDLTEDEVKEQQKLVNEKAKAKGKKGRTVYAKKKISETLLPSAMEICNALEAFNITKDPVLDKKRRELKAILNEHYDASTDTFDLTSLKDKDTGAVYRSEMVEKVNEVKKSVDDITCKFGF